MTIKRIINGEEIEIKLSDNEMRDAFDEQEKVYLKQDVSSVIADGEDLPQDITEQELDLMVNLYKKYLDDEDWVACARDAIDFVLNLRTK